MSVPRIKLGLEVVDPAGEELAIVAIDEAKGVVTLQTLDEDDSYRLPIRELRNGLRDGTFDILEADEDEADEKDGDEDDGGDEDDDACNDGEGDEPDEEDE
jgi:hypothetical protein